MHALSDWIGCKTIIKSLQHVQTTQCASARGSHQKLSCSRCVHHLLIVLSPHFMCEGVTDGLTNSKSSSCVWMSKVNNNTNFENVARVCLFAVINF